VYSFSYRYMMRGVLAICFLVSAAMSDAFGSEEKAKGKALVRAVYSVSVAAGFSGCAGKFCCLLDRRL
jgi:hypothetical protein